MITLPETIRVLIDGSIRVLPLEEYLRAVVPQEMPSNWPTEALKAQAIAARTYAARAALYPRHKERGADVCTEEHCQAYRPAKIHARTDEAIQATAGLALIYDGRLIDALFSAACGGRTLSSEERPGWNWIAYLRSKPCPCNRRKYGHGVGMCQHGARAMAAAGQSYREILLHYYTGVEIDGPGAEKVWPEVEERLLHEDAFDKVKSARWHTEQAVRDGEHGDPEAAIERLKANVIPVLYDLERGLT